MVRDDEEEAALNVNTWGVPILFGAGIDISLYTALTLTFTKPDGSTLVVTNPLVSVPSVDEETSDGLFPANTYAQYYTRPGDINETGTWEARLTYQDSARLLTSDTPVTFTVDP